MTYEHHVFISYAHGDLWTAWVRDQFVKRLNGYLDKEVGRLHKEFPPAFADDQIQTGARWNNLLKNKVAHSTVMVCLLSADYFQSDWCRREMALMLEREKHCGMEGQGQNYGLLIPVRLGDGDCFPDLATQVQYQDFENYADLDLPPGSARASDFCKAIQHLAKTVAGTIRQAHDYSPDWLNHTGDDYFDDLQHKPLSTKPSRIPV